MNRKSQITLFVIAAIAILFLFAFLFYMRSSVGEIRSVTETKKTYRTTYDLAAVKDFTDSCLKRTMEKALLDRIGFQGGYINSTGDPKYNESAASQTFSYNNYGVPYYLQNNQNTSLSIEQIQSKLDKFTAVEIESCLNYSVFAEFNISKPSIDYNATKFNFSSVSTDFNSSINSDDVSMDIDYPLELKKEGYSSSFDEFATKVNVPFGDIYTTSQNLVKDLQDEDEEYELDANCATLIPDGCPSEKISRISAFSNQGEPPKDYIIIIESDTISELFNFQFAVTREDEEQTIEGECSC